MVLTQSPLRVLSDSSWTALVVLSPLPDLLHVNHFTISFSTSVADHRNLCRKNAYPRLLSLFPLAAKDMRLAHAIIDTLERFLTLRSASRYMVERCGVLSWLLSIGCISTSMANSMTSASNDNGGNNDGEGVVRMERRPCTVVSPRLLPRILLLIRRCATAVYLLQQGDGMDASHGNTVKSMAGILLNQLVSYCGNSNCGGTAASIPKEYFRQLVLLLWDVHTYAPSSSITATALCRFVSILSQVYEGRKGSSSSSSSSSTTLMKDELVLSVCALGCTASHISPSPASAGHDEEKECALVLMRAMMVISTRRYLCPLDKQGSIGSGNGSQNDDGDHEIYFALDAPSYSTLPVPDSPAPSQPYLNAASMVSLHTPPRRSTSNGDSSEHGGNDGSGRTTEDVDTVWSIYRQQNLAEMATPLCRLHAYTQTAVNTIVMTVGGFMPGSPSLGLEMSMDMLRWSCGLWSVYYQPHAQQWRQNHNREVIADTLLFYVTHASHSGDGNGSDMAVMLDRQCRHYCAAYCQLGVLALTALLETSSALTHHMDHVTDSASSASIGAGQTLSARAHRGKRRRDGDDDSVEGGIVMESTAVWSRLVQYLIDPAKSNTNEDDDRMSLVRLLLELAAAIVTKIDCNEGIVTLQILENILLEEKDKMKMLQTECQSREI